MNETPEQQSMAYRVYASNSAQANSIEAENDRLEAELGFTAPKPEESKPGPKVEPTPIPVHSDIASYQAPGAGDMIDTAKKNVKEIPGAIGGGLTDAVQGIGNTALDMYDWASKYAKDNGYLDGKFVPSTHLDFSDGIFPPEQTATGKLTRAATAFVAPFLAGTGAASKIGMLASVPRWARNLGVAAAVDFSVWDPKGERLSNFIQEVPWMANPITHYLASKPGDSAAEGRFKQMLEGTGLGALTEGVFLAVKGLKGIGHAEALSKAETRGAISGGVPPEGPSAAGAISPELKTSAEAGAPVSQGPAPSHAEVMAQTEALHGTQVVDESGKPIQVYHGTAESFGSHNPDAPRIFHPKNLENGIWFTSEPKAAETFAVDSSKVKQFKAWEANGKVGDFPGEELFREHDAAVKDLESGKITEDQYKTIQADLQKRDLEISSQGGANIRPTYLNFKNPLTVDLEKTTQFGGFHADEPGYYSAIIKKAKAAGKDGVIFKNAQNEAGFVDANTKKGTVYVAFDHGQVVSPFSAPAPAKAAVQSAVDAELKAVQSKALTPKAGTEVTPVAAKPAIEFPHSVPEDGNFLEPVVSGEKDVQVSGEHAQGYKVNLNKVTASTDALKILKESSFKFQDEISKAAGGIQTDEQAAKELASDLGITVQQLMKRPAGVALNRNQMDKARMFLASAAEDFTAKAKKAMGPGATDIDKAVMIDALDGLRVLQAQVGGAKAETARTLRSLRIPIGAAKGERLAAIIDQVMKVHGRDNIEEIARVVTDAASKKDIDMVKFLGTWQKKGMGGRVMDALWETWINGLLSRPTTHIVNATSNTLAVANNAFETGLARASTLIRSGDVADGVAAGELTAKIAGMFEGAIDAAKVTYRQTLSDVQGKLGLNKWSDANAAKATELGKGTYLDSNVKSEMPRVPAISSQNFDLGGVPVLGSTVNKFIDVIGGTTRLPSYAMNSSDMFFKLANYRMELNALAVKDSTEKGLTGQAFKDNVARIVANPPDEIILKSREAALYHTYNNDLEGSLQYLDKFIKSVPPLRLVFPFTRTPSNIFMYGLDRMPGLNMVFSSDIRNNFLKPTREGDFARAKIASGMALAGALVYALKDNITGSGPLNPEAKRAKEATGWREDSIKVGNEWVQYKRVDPFANILGMGADYMELAGHLNDKDQQALALAFAGLTVKNLTPEFMVEHASQLIDAIKNPDKDGKKFIASLSASLVPGIVKDIRKAQDPAKRDTSPDPTDSSTSQIWQKIVNGIKASTPGFSEDLPPLRNMFGEVVNYDHGIGPDVVSPIVTSKETDDPVIKEMVRLNLAGPLYKTDPKPGERDLTLSMPPRHITVNGLPVELTPKEYSDYVKLSAGIGLQGQPTLKDKLAQVIRTEFPRIKNDQQRRDVILNVVNAYRKGAAGQLVKDDNLFDRIQRSGQILKDIKTRNDMQQGASQ